MARAQHEQDPHQDPDERADHDRADELRDEVPSTIARSDDEAVRTFAATLESARGSYGEGERARRTAFAALKHTHEKVGDHWEPKDGAGPSDPQAALSGDAARDGGRATAGGVDATASKAHLVELADRLGISGATGRTKAELVDEIRRANDRATARARREDD